MRTCLLIGLLIIGLNQLVPKQTDKAHANQGSDKAVPSEPAKPATVNALPPRPSAQQEQGRADRQTQQAGWRKRVLNVMGVIVAPVIANWPLILVAIWGILVARGTLNTIRAQTKATQDSVKALIDSERAWLLGPSIRLPDIIPVGSSQTVFFYVPIENLGKTVGRVVKTSANRALYGILPPEPSYEVRAGCDMVLAPHGAHKLWAAILASEMEYVRSKRGKRLYFYGFVQYFDIGDILRETRFCYVYHMPTNYTPEPEGFYPDANAPTAYTKCT